MINNLGYTDTQIHGPGDQCSKNPEPLLSPKKLPRSPLRRPLPQGEKRRQDSKRGSPALKMLRDLWLRGESRAGKALVRPRPARTLSLVHSLHSSTICRQPTSWQRASPVGHTHTHTPAYHGTRSNRGASAACARGVSHSATTPLNPGPAAGPLVSQGAGGDRDPPILQWVQRPLSNSWQPEEAGRCGRAARSLGAGAPAREERAVCSRELGALDLPCGRHEHQYGSKGQGDTRGGRGRQR